MHEGFTDPVPRAGLLTLGGFAAVFGLFHFLGVRGAGDGRVLSLFAWIGRIWQSCGWRETYWFCPLMPAIALGFFWINRRTWRGAAPRPDGRGWVPALVGLALHGIGLWRGMPGLSFLGLTALIGALVLGVWGTRILGAAAVPLCFLLLAVPWELPDAPVQSLFQRGMAAATYRTLRVFGFEVHRQELLLVGPRLAFRVAPACSGLRALISLGLLSLGIAGLVRWRWWRRVLLVALSVPFALFSNWLRLVLLGVACSVWGQERVMAPWFPEAAEGTFRGLWNTEQFLGTLILPIGAVLLLVAFEIMGRREKGCLTKSSTEIGERA